MCCLLSIFEHFLGGFILSHIQVPLLPRGLFHHAPCPKSTGRVGAGRRRNKCTTAQQFRPQGSANAGNRSPSICLQLFMRKLVSGNCEVMDPCTTERSGFRSSREWWSGRAQYKIVDLSSSGPSSTCQQSKSYSCPPPPYSSTPKQEGFRCI